ncbi:MAG: HyaD/HybD family hydrogenase maturation endopeptidase [Sulfurimonadaceae bacterium]|jgi:hydrogenase maturation protease|nr:HyaD/HybD family hydrogenase maturation endopeptidase [Sulfurimonadaceae bacterium]
MKTAVIGVGNIIFRDDGIGVYATRFLEENYIFNQEVSFIDGGTLGIHLLHYYEEFEQVFILDTISLEDKIGSIYNIPSYELLELGGHKNTAHEVEVSDMIATSLFLETPAEIRVLGIVPQDIISVSIGLSEELEDAFISYTDAILEALLVGGISATRKEEITPLHIIIDSYQNPKGTRFEED